MQYLLTALLDLIVGILSISKKKNPSARALAYVSFSLFFWQIELYLLVTIKNLEILSPLFHLTRWGVFFSGPLFALLAWRMLGSRSKVFLHWVVIPSLTAAVLLSITNFFFLPSMLEPSAGGYLPAPDLISFGYNAIFAWASIGSLAVTVFHLKYSSRREQKRIKWMAISLVVAFGGGVLALTSSRSDTYLQSYIGPLTHVVYSALVFYAVVEHNLMDFRFAFSVGLARSILLGLVVWLYFLVDSFSSYFGGVGGSAFAMLAFVLVMIEVYPRALKWIVPQAKRWLASSRYDLDKVKVDMVDTWNNSVSVESFRKSMDYLLLELVQVKDYRLLMILEHGRGHISGEMTSFERLEGISSDDLLVEYCRNQEGIVLSDETPRDIAEEMERRNACLCLKVRQGTKIVAILVIDNPQDYQDYRYEDIRLFEWMAVELAPVLSRLLRIDEMNDELGEAKKTLSLLNVMNHYHHDIKAPLAIIDGVLSSDIYDEEKKVRIVLEQVNRSNRLITTMSSILHGKRERKTGPISLKMVLQDALYLFDKGVDGLTFDCEGDPAVIGDAEDLKIMFVNLIKNATEARQEGSDVELVVRVWATDKVACIKFSDNGIGMDESRLARMWTSASTTKVGGTGIGLQAVKRIADEHRAAVNVSSVLGEGTTFMFEFPLVSATNDINLTS
ncbi:MAG: hypothetical protein COA42_20960 [Alteromonadaceae bacterium]|nr:MAG: hypothetical protein COA42_20960 [Alteromonadaceae bacterium]